MTSYTKYSIGVPNPFGAALYAVLFVGQFIGAVATVHAIPPEIRIDTINGLPSTSYSCPGNPLSNPVVIMGSGRGTAPPGRIEQYGVQISWGDGSPIQVATSTFTPPRGRGDFTYTFQTPAHTYPNGSFTLSISLFHSQTGGNDNQIDSTVTFQVCTFNPITPTIQLDLINGQSPNSFSCPDNPVQNPVVVSGSGVGSAPPSAVENYSVSINWGDGSPAESAVADFTPSSGSGVNFTYEFDSLDHSYAAGGNYNVTIALEYPNPGGPGNLVAASQTFSICAFTPVTPTLQVDLLNGQDPEAMSCPDSPLESPVVIAGSGQGSAPPGNVEDYDVIVDWGDGSPVEGTLANFAPGSGFLVNFTYDFETLDHEYTQSGNYTVTLSLVYTDSAGDQTVVTQNIDVCVRLPFGTVTGRVTDSLTGWPIFGATIEDITDQTAILGSFPGGSVYVIQPTPGLRTIRVRAKAWQDAIAQVNVIENEVTTRDFVLNFVQTNQNIAGAILPIGSSGKKLYLLPECVEALINGVVVDTTCVHAGNTYFFVGLPNGPTKFRGKNVFYQIAETEINLTDGTQGTRTERGYREVRLQTEPPEAQTRAPVITGGIIGQTSDGVSSVATTVFATFGFEGTPVTVSNETTNNGVYAIDLIPPGSAEVYAHATSTSARSVDTPVNVVGGVFTTRNLTVFPVDPETDNFVPIITSPTEVDIDEDINVLLDIDQFTVTDLNNVFSAEHSLVVYPGFNYTISTLGPKTSQVNPFPNYNGLLSVPVSMSDGTNTSSPFNLMIGVSAVPDPTVYVNFDTGQTGINARGTAASPFRTVGAALGVVSPGGTVLVGGLSTSREPPFVINQPVTLVNNNPGGEVVVINPNQASSLILPTTQTGFVSDTSKP